MFRKYLPLFLLFFLVASVFFALFFWRFGSFSISLNNRQIELTSHISQNLSVRSAEIEDVLENIGINDLSQEQITISVGQNGELALERINISNNGLEVVLLNNFDHPHSLDPYLVERVSDQRIVSYTFPYKTDEKIILPVIIEGQDFDREILEELVAKAVFLLVANENLSVAERNSQFYELLRLSNGDELTSKLNFWHEFKVALRITAQADSRCGGHAFLGTKVITGGTCGGQICGPDLDGDGLPDCRPASDIGDPCTNNNQCEASLCSGASETCSGTSQQFSCYFNDVQQRCTIPLTAGYECAEDFCTTNTTTPTCTTPGYSYCAACQKCMDTTSLTCNDWENANCGGGGGGGGGGGVPGDPGDGSQTCSGQCFGPAGGDNCGSWGKADASGTCSNGGFCCQDPTGPPLCGPDNNQGGTCGLHGEFVGTDKPCCDGLFNVGGVCECSQCNAYTIPYPDCQGCKTVEEVLSFPAQGASSVNVAYDRVADEYYINVQISPDQPAGYEGWATADYFKVRAAPDFITSATSFGSVPCSDPLTTCLDYVPKVSPTTTVRIEVPKGAARMKIFMMAHNSCDQVGPVSRDVALSYTRVVYRQAAPGATVSVDPATGRCVTDQQPWDINGWFRVDEELDFMGSSIVPYPPLATSDVMMEATCQDWDPITDGPQDKNGHTLTLMRNTVGQFECYRTEELQQSPPVYIPGSGQTGDPGAGVPGQNFSYSSRFDSPVNLDFQDNYRFTTSLQQLGTYAGEPYNMRQYRASGADAYQTLNCVCPQGCAYDSVEKVTHPAVGSEPLQDTDSGLWGLEGPIIVFLSDELTVGPWFQVWGGSTGALGAITSGIPDTSCSAPDCINALNRFDRAGTSLSDGIALTSGASITAQSSQSSNDLNQRPEQLGVVGGFNNVLELEENFTYFRRLYQIGTNPSSDLDEFGGNADALSKPGSNQTYYWLSSDVTIEDSWDVGSSEEIVVFVDGNLTLTDGDDSDGDHQLISVAEGGYLQFIVSGEIVINSNLGNEDITDVTSNLEGVYLSDGPIVIETTGSIDDRFVGEGIFVGWGGVELNRALGTGEDENGLYPAETFIYRPDFVINTPEQMLRPERVWTERV